MLIPLLLIILNLAHLNIENNNKYNLYQSNASLFPYFKSSLAVDLQVMLTHYILKGELVVDSEVNGMYSGVYGDDPNNYWGKLNASVVVHPNIDESVTVSEVRNAKCGTKYDILKGSIPKYGIPDSATYKGKRMVEKIECDTWRLEKPYQDVYYTDIMINDGKIWLIEVSYNAKTNDFDFDDKVDSNKPFINVYIYVKLTNHDLNKPSKDWFNTQEECK